MAPKRKLVGAQAKLFAQICEHYIHAAETECNDTPDDLPIFSRLSPHQRLKLVSDVMIGVLCEKEPFPPNTVQHNATYRALIETLFTELEVEFDEQYMRGDIGEDILNYDQEDSSNRRSPEEMEEYDYKLKLIEYQAEKNMEKMKRKVERGKDVGEFVVEESNVEPPDSTYLKDRTENLKSLFLGGAMSQDERNSMRSLTDDEKYVFSWRRLCDAAFQEDFSFPFPLATVNFDWRCQKKSKWYAAINLLLENYDYGTAKERGIIMGPINAHTYADPKQLPRIRAVEKHVEVLRKIYESSWNPMQLSFDQRCIFAVCSNELYCGHGHNKFLNAFVTSCNANGIDFEKEGNYQARLDIFREMKPNHMEGLEYPYGASSARVNLKDWVPSNFSGPQFEFDGVSCHGPST